jgi:hypothetical protein
MKIWPVAAGLAAVVSSGTNARAEPQANAALTIGVAGTGEQAWWSNTRFSAGARADVLLGRSNNRHFGVGPYAELLTLSRDLQLGGGASVLLPVHADLPIVLSGGPYGRYSANWGWEPGVSGQLFWGSRSYNYHSWYVMAAGLVGHVRYGLGDSHERAVLIALHLDGEVLALPFLLLYEALFGPRPK